MSNLRVFFFILSATCAWAYTCKSGTYGRNCQLKCPDKCRPYSCDETTGRCVEGCVDGYWGATCDQRCSCPSRTCAQDTGKCGGYNIAQSIRPPTGASTGPPPRDRRGVSPGWRVTAIVFITLCILLILAVIFMCLLLRKLKNQSRHLDDQRSCLDKLPCFSAAAQPVETSPEENAPMTTHNTPAGEGSGNERTEEKGTYP